MKKEKLKQSILAAVILAVAFVACRREEVGHDEQAGAAQSRIHHGEAGNKAVVKGNSAAAHIAASEKLEIPAAVDLPSNLPQGNSRVATYYAVGVQKYKAREKAGSNPVAYEWVFVAPEAVLYDVSNTKVGTHSAGPNWALSVFDSIFAQQYAPPKTSPSPDAGSIDWLLLKPKAGTTPSGIFADVAYIQRIATKGGKAPVTAPVSLNETVDVKYKAVYRFTRINP